MNSIKISSAGDRYRQDISINDKFQLIADQPKDLGGDNAGATPVELLMAALGSCKAITIQIYAKRKGWELENVKVDVDHQQINRRYHISVRFHLAGNLTSEQKQRLLIVSSKCPVHKLLQSEAQIDTILADNG